MMTVAPVLVARIIGRLELQRPHAADLQVLVDRHGVAEPADVADVDEDRGRQRRVGEARAQFLAEQVFVADVGRQPLALPFEGSLADRAAVEVAQRDVHHRVNQRKQGRDEFAETAPGGACRSGRAPAGWKPSTELV
jgi:hypothetical protein